MASRIDLLMDQGSSFSVGIDFRSDDGRVDFTNYTAASKMRMKYNPDVVAILNASCYSNGSIFLSMGSAQTGSIVAGEYLYDVEVTDASGSTLKVVHGVLTVTPSVTRDE